MPIIYIAPLDWEEDLIKAEIKHVGLVSQEDRQREIIKGENGNYVIYLNKAIKSSVEEVGPKELSKEIVKSLYEKCKKKSIYSNFFKNCLSLTLQKDTINLKPVKRMIQDLKIVYNQLGTLSERKSQEFFSENKSEIRGIKRVIDELSNQLDTIGSKFKKQRRSFGPK